MSQVFSVGETVKVTQSLTRTEAHTFRGRQCERVVSQIASGATGVVVGQQMGCPVVRFKNGVEEAIMPCYLRRPNWYDTLTRGADCELRDENGALAFGPSVVTGAIRIDF